MFELSNDNVEVTFHPKSSPGTAVIRGNKPLKKGKHYYWEIKILSCLYGTDVVSIELISMIKETHPSIQIKFLSADDRCRH